MNKTAIKNFAIWARNRLIADMKYRAGLLGITEAGIANALPQSTGTTEFYDIGTAEPYAIDREEIRQRNALVQALRKKEEDSDYATAYKYIIEEVAYTWFNRLIAVRFMEVNDYLPSRVRVLSSETGKTEPDLVTNPFDAELDFDSVEEEKIIMLKRDNKIDEVFRLLFIKQCNALNEILPALFEKTSDYTELLLNLSVVDQDGVVYHLVHDIPEEDFDISAGGQVEIIGWLYQYYISEKHDQIVNIYKGTIKKDDIPAATQLFTTDWVVRYMVDNSLGRYWIERHPDSKLGEKLQFLVNPKDGIQYINEKIEPEELTFFDPCMGSGHILVYAFDVLMEIYREVGYTDREAAKSILKNNLFGLDIDQRAYQLAYFAVVMKARSYNRRLFTNKVNCNVFVINESNGIDQFFHENITIDEKQNAIGEYLIKVFRHAKEIGSLQTVKPYNYDEFDEYLDNCEITGQMNLFDAEWVMRTVPLMHKLIDQAKVMSRKYSVVCTNPPYMNKMEGNLKEYIVERYKLYGTDLFSVFMFRNFDYCKENGYSAFMTPFVWMFIKAYENLRNFIVDEKTIITLIQMEYSAFEEATVPICSFVLQNGKTENYGRYFKLSEFRGGMDVQRKKVIEGINNSNCSYLYKTNQKNYKDIPGTPIAFWLPKKMFEDFRRFDKVEKWFEVRNGITTGDNNKFLKLWFEPSVKSTKWYPCNKGGSFRKWDGNRDYCVEWENDGYSLKNFVDEKGKQRSTLRGIDYNFTAGITMSRITSGSPSFRLMYDDSISESATNAIYPKSGLKMHTLNLMGLLNSKVGIYMLDLLNPTINVVPEDIRSIPVSNCENEIVEKIVDSNVSLSKVDWNSFEISWDFEKHPLVPSQKDLQEHSTSQFASSRMEKFGLLSWHFEKWQQECEERFNQLKTNEEELNRIFIDIYGLQDELTPEVEDKDVTVRKADLQRDMKSLLSYAVGCMFGRYSVYKDGLMYAGGEWNLEDYKFAAYEVSNSDGYPKDVYSSQWFMPDEDNVIPITDEEYLEDDIVSRLCEWLKAIYGVSTLEENLDFIAQALGCKGSTSREIIRNYFLNDFFKDHCATYSVTGSGKRPIYWLFDSGKQNGFKALVYLHRYNADTIGNVRVEYLYRMQRVYEAEIGRMQDTIDHSSNNREVSLATKRKEKLQKQLKECREYDEKIGHLALSRIELDLDDGVKVNYRKVQTASDGKFYEILADSKNIMVKK